MPDRPPRFRTRSCRRVLCSILAILCLTSSIYYIPVLYKWSQGPHSNLFQTLEVPYKLDEVVRPVVDSTQTFDIVATVWVKDEIQKSGQESRVVRLPIFSGTIFRGLRLQDKNVKTAVNFSLPINVFSKEHGFQLLEDDLHASVVLIPNQPSPLSFAIGYSNWIPQAIQRQMRPRQYDQSRTLADEIVESSAAIVPLLEFHPILVECAEPEAADEQVLNPIQQSLQSLAKENIIEHYPFIATRTHIRVLDETNLYNWQAFDLAHNALAWRACTAGYRKCRKTFTMMGNLETAIKLGIPDVATGINSTEWAYLPYIESSPTANGPLDLIPAPLSRTGCWTVVAGDNRSALLDSDSNDYVNVTWNIAFSGRTPSKLMATHTLEQVFLAQIPLMRADDTYHARQKTQKDFERLNGISGYRIDDSHPRIMFVAKSACMGLFAFAHILRSHYWFSRSTTVGISFTGTYLLIFGFLVEYTIKGLRDSYSTGHTPPIQRLLAGPRGLPANITMIFMGKVITLLQMRQGFLRFRSLTHAERASRRIDARTPRSFIILAYATLALLFFSSEYFQIFAKRVRGINGSLPGPNTSDRITELSMLIISLPAANLGNTLQTILNLRRKTFGGNYRLGAWVYAGASFLLLIVDTPGTLYRATFDVVLPWDAIVELLLTAILAFQAVIYAAGSREEQVIDE